METLYKLKYMKYKNKYLELKEQIGGVKFKEIIDNGISLYKIGKLKKYINDIYELIDDANIDNIENIEKLKSIYIKFIKLITDNDDKNIFTIVNAIEKGNILRINSKDVRFYSDDKNFAIDGFSFNYLIKEKLNEKYKIKQLNYTLLYHIITANNKALYIINNK